jgi:hypothetical protein
LSRRFLLAWLAGWSAVAAAQDDETPDLSFLEYLGSWRESDEEWLMVVEAAAEAADEAGEEERRNEDDETGPNEAEPTEDGDED